MIENGEKLIPIRPICEALGIDEESQRKKILSDEILSSVAVLRTATGGDGKQYKMNCIPLMFVFGWLFTINPKNVKPEAQEAVKKYRLECYMALFRHFSEQSEFLKQKQQAIEKQLEAYERFREEFNTAKNKLSEARDSLNEIRRISFEEWQANNRQLTLEFPVSINEQ